jgi:hypothetical protein
MRAVVCTHSRHDLAALAVAHLRRHATGITSVTVLDASGTMAECEGADEVRHAPFPRNAGPCVAANVFRGEDLLCIDDDVMLVEPLDAARYMAGISKPQNGFMVFARRHAPGTVLLPQVRIRSTAGLEKYPWAAEAARHRCELIDGVWLHIDRGSTGASDARDALEVAIRGGPGTELKSLLKTIGIVAKPNCSCNKRARVMDENGCDWCEEHIDEIDGWLAEEAKKRKLPYLSLAGKTLIRLAIRRARKKGNSR